ncbi:solute carrier family 38 member 9 [Phyllostomus discolor]|nr:solute carrier family 38 member 9 [Phyllostomus discolor]
MMTVYPLLGYLARVQLLGHVFGDVYPSVFHVLVLNLLIVGAGVLTACFYPNIGGIIRYSGAACGLAFVFVYPALTYILALRQEGRLTWPRLLAHVAIIVLGLANLIVQFFL